MFDNQDLIRRMDMNAMIANSNLCHDQKAELREYLEAVPAVQIAVKPLEWSGNSARSLFGLYQIDYVNGPKPEDVMLAISLTNHGIISIISDKRWDEGQEAAVRVAAQADFEARIRSALIEPAQSEPMRCTECDCANGGADCTWIKMHMDRIDQSGKEVMPDDKPTTYLQHQPVDASPGVTAGAASPDVQAMEKARIGPHVTCPASRHAAMIAEALVKGQAYPMLAEDPAHCGETIAVVVAALWNARAEWSEAARSADQAEDEVARLRDILQFVEMFTATAHGLSSSDTMTIHRIAAEGRSDDPAAWRVDPAVIDQLRAAVSRVKGGGE